MRVRIRFAKTGKIRWTSHRDTARMWERAFRRIELPLGYSAGFSPRPKVSFGLALPTGHDSVAEYLDIELAGGSSVDVPALPEKLTAALPTGVDALVASVIADREPSLQEEVTSCTWRLAVHEDGDDRQPVAASALRRTVAALLDRGEAVITRQRKGRDVTEDVRPGVISLTVLEAGPHPGTWLECELGTRPRGLRPLELVSMLDPAFEAAHICRLHQWIERDGERREPLVAPPGAPDAPRALERVS
jgi:radical SAM-linked protein